MSEVRRWVIDLGPEGDAGGRHGRGDTCSGRRERYAPARYLACALNGS
jgi:hypothetical protein